MVKKLRKEDGPLTICRRTDRTSSGLAFTGQVIQGWDEDLATLWNDAMDEANLLERERQAASLGAHSFSSCRGTSASPLSDEPAESPEEPRLQGSGLRERPDAGDGETSVPPRNPLLPPSSVEKLGQRCALCRQEVSMKKTGEEDQSGYVGHGLRERLDAGENQDETSMPPRNPRIPPTSAEEPVAYVEA